MTVSALKLLGIDVGPIAIYDSPSPIIARASCTPNEMGTPDVAFGGRVELVRPLLANRLVPVPEPNKSTSATVTRLANYTATVSNKQVSELGYALAEVRLRLTANALLSGDEIWTLDIILARSECGLSKPLRGGVVPIVAGRGTTMNPVMDGAFTAEQEDATAEDGETGTLGDAFVKADARESGAPEAATAASPTPEDDADGRSDTAGDTTSPSTGTTSTTIPELADQTATVSSESSSTSMSTPTRTTTSTTKSSVAPPATSAPNTSTPAAPAIVIPDEPADLERAVRIEDVEPVTVEDAERVVVVVEGTFVPTDARAGAAALEAWLGDNATRTGDWNTVASNDSAQNGWRWAAINQKTGTVVYIR